MLTPEIPSRDKRRSTASRIVDWRSTFASGSTGGLLTRGSLIRARPASSVTARHLVSALSPLATAGEEAPNGRNVPGGLSHTHPSWWRETHVAHTESSPA